ncbi:unnamed protein product, partial [Laminaria digitata]
MHEIDVFPASLHFLLASTTRALQSLRPVLRPPTEHRLLARPRSDQRWRGPSTRRRGSKFRGLGVTQHLPSYVARCRERYAARRESPFIMNKKMRSYHVEKPCAYHS